MEFHLFDWICIGYPKLERYWVGFLDSRNRIRMLLDQIVSEHSVIEKEWLEERLRMERRLHIISREKLKSECSRMGIEMPILLSLLSEEAVRDI